MSLATRSSSGVADHLGKASRALETARSTRATFPSGHLATTVPSAGFNTSKVRGAGVALPPIVSANGDMQSVSSSVSAGGGRRNLLSINQLAEHAPEVGERGICQDGEHM